MQVAATNRTQLPFGESATLVATLLTEEAVAAQTGARIAAARRPGGAGAPPSGFGSENSRNKGKGGKVCRRSAC